MKHLFFHVAVISLLAPGIASADADKIKAVENGLQANVVFEGDKGWTISERMTHYGVPGVSVAVIEDFKVAWYKTYGLADQQEGIKAVESTLFQAGSVSKPVAAFGAMQMVGAGSLSLDGNINKQLKTWKLPENEFTRQHEVSLKQLLSHTGGLTVHGFLGYAEGLDVPTLVQVLNGASPANSDAIVVDKLPGEGFRYSGGGYSIAQQMMIDVSDQAFPELMQKQLLGPAGMKRSTFNQPLTPAQLKFAAAGVLPDGRDVPGKRHVYPEMAAAGLWTTAEDLALFAIAMQDSLRGKSKLLSRDLAQQMITPVDAAYGLGFGVSNKGDDLYFGHGGWDEGFCATLTAHREKGYGAVVMINSNHPDFMNEVINSVAFAYGWGGYKIHTPQNVPQELLGSAPGRYRYNSELSITVYREEDRLFLRYAGNKPVELLYIGDGQFMRRERATPIIFDTSGEKAVFNFIVDGGDRQAHTRLSEDEKLARDILVAGDFEAAVAAYRAISKADPEDAAGSEGYLNNEGLQLLTDGPELGLQLLLVNTRLYPDSANTWDSVAYAYQQAGDTVKAIQFYREALKRDPKFASALQALKELEATP